MNLSGLSSNFYLANNPIYLSISGIDDRTPYIDYFISVYDNQGSITSTSKPQRSYNLNNTLSVDIAPLIKSFMSEPNHNTNYTELNPFPFYFNHIKINITVREYEYKNTVVSDPEGGLDRIVFSTEIVNTDTISNKTFIRGGKRTYDNNINLGNATNLIVTDKIPVWSGLPVDYYYTNLQDGIVKTNIIPGELKDERTVKGCESIYVKFLNSLGGYSYWLFENSEVQERNSNLGSIRRQLDVLDLGNESEETITLISKVPQRFMPLMKDLIVSPEIYRYEKENQEWHRLSSDNNRITTNPFEVNTKVKLKFNPYSNYNPAVIW
jgi:hypothetical protein